MKKYALIGHPLGHSMSPMIHYKLFSLSGCKECVYQLTDISPEELPQQQSYLRGLDGFNITIPHKTSVIPMLSELSESAARYNSVNCVKNDNGRLIGFNTDCDGFLRSVEGFPLDGRVLLLGCGGAGRMMALEAALHGAELTIAVRPSSVRKAQVLMAEILAKCGSSARIIDIPTIQGDFDVLLNATPVGMYPDIKECPVSDSVIEHCAYFFDAVYNPDKTLLIRKALAAGKKAVGGTAMLVYQAIKAHEIWDNEFYTDEQANELIKSVKQAVSAL